ncbi:hypothetical protein [Aquimarina algiphila]|uniref:hypothetical protein n=1 Tax=Aquimarina algiphila TaxID=2047982 RepID=UPI00249134EB|nr:hypothetical protein [Aquimarina algiphila]
MRQSLIILLILSIFTSCSNSTKKPDKSKSEKLTVESDEKKIDPARTELDIQKTFLDFVKLAKVPDSLNFDVDNVFYGDFNGDNKKDFASPVINLENGFYGLIIIHNDSNPKYRVFGAGNEINGQTNLDWIDKFKVIPKGRNIVPTLVDEKTGDIIGPDQTKTFKLIGDGILMSVDESHGGGILFWNGKNYEWYHIE